MTATKARPSATETASEPQDTPATQWVERIALTNFRSYPSLSLDLTPAPVVLTGANGAGKTNILEAISLLMPGQGLRRATYSDLARADGDGNWAVATRVHSRFGALDIGTGRQPVPTTGFQPERSGRAVRINGETKGGSGALSDYVDVVWVTPAMDGLFTGPASERRRFLDRLVICFDPSFRVLTGRFERAMQSRNRLLADGVSDAPRVEGFEIVMAETATAIAAARAQAIAALGAVVADRQARDPTSPFPWSRAVLDGTLEQALATDAAVDVEDAYLHRLGAMRDRDRAAGRTLEGPHRSDLQVIHGPKDMPARLCSTGEQKVLLLGLVLAQAELIARRHHGTAPVVLLDEVAAHLDTHRRTALFDEILRLNVQAWMTGTDTEMFASLRGKARLLHITQGSAEEVG